MVAKPFAFHPEWTKGGMHNNNNYCFINFEARKRCPKLTLIYGAYLTCFVKFSNLLVVEEKTDGTTIISVDPDQIALNFLCPDISHHQISRQVEISEPPRQL